jgi:hypothetical protein
MVLCSVAGTGLLAGMLALPAGIVMHQIVIPSTFGLRSELIDEGRGARAGFGAWWRYRSVVVMRRCRVVRITVRERTSAAKFHLGSVTRAIRPHG